MGRYSFGKEERLCSKRVIDELFQNGSSLKEYPLRVIYKELETASTTAQVLISVPKKRFGKAVSRNRIKRLIREVYRLSKPELLENWENQGKYFAVAFVYIGNEIPNYDNLMLAMQRALNKLKTLNE